MFRKAGFYMGENLPLLYRRQGTLLPPVLLFLPGAAAESGFYGFPPFLQDGFPFCPELLPGAGHGNLCFQEPVFRCCRTQQADAHQHQDVTLPFGEFLRVGFSNL